MRAYPRDMSASSLEREAMRRLFIAVGLALAVPVFIIVAFTLMPGRGQATPGSNAGQPGQQAGQQYNDLNDLTPIPEGSPAPNPVATADAQYKPRSVAGASALTPPLTEEKVRAYVEGDPNVGEVAAKSFHADSIRFATVGEMKAQLKAENRNDPFLDNYPLDRQIVYVTLSGEFHFFDMDNQEHIYHRAFRVFDAETGNELMGGAGPEK